MQFLTLLPGRNKEGEKESFKPLELMRGDLYTIVGNTGSGKSRLLKDIEQLAEGDSITARKVLLDGKSNNWEERRKLSSSLVAHLGQNMRFVLDVTVEEFLRLHASCRGKRVEMKEVLEVVNEITPEPVCSGQSLNRLSGGQSRALMIADIALICDSPIVLIDEIENAGVDKEKAFSLLQSKDKLVLVVTHDPHTALMAPARIVMGQGGIRAVIERSKEEEKLFNYLRAEYRRGRYYQEILRNGEVLS